MARVRLLEGGETAQTQELADRISKGRRGNLLGIYKALLHNPKLAETWFAHLNAVRWETGLGGRLREIMIIRIGWLLRSAYILKQHVPKLAAPEGLDEAHCRALQSDAVEEYFLPAEIAAIRLADEVTIEARASGEAMAEVKKHYDDKMIVEMMVLIGTYNMHARFVSGLDIELEKD